MGIENALESGLTPRLVHERDAAKFLNVSVAWLQRQRWLGTGPIWIRVGGPQGRAVRYRYADLQAWIESNAVSGGSHKGCHA